MISKDTIIILASDKRDLRAMSITSDSSSLYFKKRFKEMIVILNLNASNTMQLTNVHSFKISEAKINYKEKSVKSTIRMR